MALYKRITRYFSSHAIRSLRTPHKKYPNCGLSNAYTTHFRNSNILYMIRSSPVSNWFRVLPRDEMIASTPHPLIHRRISVVTTNTNKGNCHIAVSYSHDDQPQLRSVHLFTCCNLALDYLTHRNDLLSSRRAWKLPRGIYCLAKNYKQMGWRLCHHRTSCAKMCCPHPPVYGTSFFRRHRCIVHKQVLTPVSEVAIVTSKTSASFLALPSIQILESPFSKATG